MKTEINKGAKRAISLAIAFALLIGTLFTANVGININAGAETAVKVTKYWDGTTATQPTKKDGDGNFLITSAEELAWLVQNTDTDASYKVSDDVAAFVLQPENTANISTLMSYTDYSDVKSYFETNSSNLSKWKVKDDQSKAFKGTFDGNGATIYGMYVTGGITGLFAWVSAGATIKNVAIKNSYSSSTDCAGIVFGRISNRVETGMANVENCEISGCYSISSSSNTGRVGVVFGYCYPNTGSPNWTGLEIGVALNNIFVHNNYAIDSTNTVCGLYGCVSSAYNGTTAGVPNISITNALILGCTPYSAYINNQAAHPVFYTNVYTDNYDPSKGVPMTATWYATNAWDGKIFKIDDSSVKGINGKKNLGLDWAENGDTASGKWYVRENDYPTLFYYDGWTDIELPDVFAGAQASSYQSGTGTKEDPYIIKTTAQLYKMVNSGEEGKGKYFKVHDKITEFYLNDIRDSKDDDLTALKKLYDDGKGDFQKWEPTGDFYGHFDGNGVTIKGMINTSATASFVKMMAKDASIENVNFSGCYLVGANAAAVTTKFSGGGRNSGDLPVISGISVRYSHIESTCDLKYDNTSLGYGLDGFYVANTTARRLSIATAGGIATLTTAPQMLTISNCLYDGVTCELEDKGDKGSEDTNVTSAVAGILSMTTASNNVTITNCVSLGAPLVTAATHDTDGTKLTHIRYGSAFEAYFENCYSDYDYDTYCYDFDWDVYSDIQDIYDNYVDTSDAYEQSDFYTLDFANCWEITNFTDNGTERAIPMPKVSTLEKLNIGYGNFSKFLASHNGGKGLSSGAYPTRNGNYGWQEELTGSGTKDDPYIITDAERLAIAIATGGQLAGQPLYYKLGCDIDLGGVTWISEKTPSDVNLVNYTYTPFIGTLDGDGHVVKGLYSIANEKATNCGLIPHLNGGTVKNLHLRDSYIASLSNAYAGGIIGKMENGTVNGCSVESTLTNNSKQSLLYAYGDGNTITNSYYISETDKKYYGAEPNTVVDLSDQNNLTDLLNEKDDNGTNIWYQVNTNPVRLVNQAKSGTTIDLDGDGVAHSAYTADDITALRSHMLNKAGYEKVYADVNRDGKVNITDLLVARRSNLAVYNDVRDGFWRNVELTNVDIYYDCNDNYDAARKVQLYLESVYPTVSVKKYTADEVVNGTIKGEYNNQNNAIVITKDEVTTANYANYSINYDYKTNVLKLNGGSFTAVEQAVLDFIGQNTHETLANPKSVSGSILNLTDSTGDKYKSAVTVDGVTYYYAWGDEFESTEKTTYSADTWKVKVFHTEQDRKDFANMEAPTVESLKDLWVVDGGKLTINRGINTNATNPYSDDYSWGYVKVNNYNNITNEKGEAINDFGSNVESDDLYVDPGLITTEKSMLFKQGYAEMRASLPSDGHAFPAWWFYNGTNVKANDTIETQILYGKVYKRNNGWDNSTTAMDPSNLSTYKYQVPNAYLEFDVVEFMQAQQTANSALGDWKDYIQLTVHKIYDQNVKDGKLYTHKWSNGVGTVTNTDGISNSDFVTTSKDGTFIHKYSATNTTAPFKHTYSGTSWNNWWKEYETGASFSVSQAKASNKYKDNDNASVTNEYTYGFAWTVDGSKYSLTVYVDFNEDGNMSNDEIIFKIDQTTGHNDSNNSSWSKLNDKDPIYNTSDTSADAEIWDQYAYMLIDNCFYTANNGDGTLFTDLFKQDTGNGTAGAKDKTTFDIDYVRVYQQDNKRDLVTAETEAFNTGSHFGY